MWFCPKDGNLLEYDGSFFVCLTCPYKCAIKKDFTRTIRPKRKAVDDILGGAQAWENVDKTATVCPKCNHGEAYFLQMQIRSADEPMSVFYKCVVCSFQWNDK